jgi:CRP/FNR family transcriptional regulator, cyclic AMP receptor protein
MAAILAPAAVLGRLASLPLETYRQGELVLRGGTSTGKLLIMTEGAVEVVRGGVRIDEIAEAGAVFGELAVLLDQPHSADVRALQASTFRVADGRTILRIDPTVALYVAVVLAQRLETVNRHLVEASIRLEQTDQPLPLLRETLDNIGRTLQHGPPL